MPRKALQRVAAFYDVHGNLPALEAALTDADAAGVELLVFGGDLALGPMPREVIDRIVALGPRARCLRGNCDRLMVDAFDGRPLGKLPPPVQEQITWAAGELREDHRGFLAALPETIELTIEGLGDVLFCHATPRSDDEIFTVRTPSERIAPMLGGVGQLVVVCGHTHMQLDRTVCDVRLLNAGSIGMPYGSPGAHWLLLGPDARFMRTGYDLSQAARSIAAADYPQAAQFAARHVVQPPSEEEMLALLEPATQPQASSPR
jgi:predicted phosphodiesterase